ncbi:dihydroxyacetone kinase phosphoryl donor subunit DhaM [Occultella aeris]|uniref:Phosphocarrier protein HPr n=1 Tax=Occultella aeris TaxID=2761496 RepID=A0A7M4DPG1_9MICO|nr:dihydroxyacetone kinase phosphoryl donor subunit DhaM [Occultella aeris]VZO39347.1 PTS-dependent dihydroxyacetone kinase, phosphotransferase subunit DhaM [Occultella aeris]
MSAATALVLVSHSAQLAAGAVEVAQQMAPDVAIRAAGGTEDGRIGTSYDLVEQAVTALLDGGATAVAILTDLGSAALTAESVVDVLDDDRVVMVDAPFVEGAVAAAVAAQSGGDAAAVGAAARTAIDSFGDSATIGASTTAGDVAVEAADAVERSVVLRNRLGLHARPAATLARKAADFDAEVTLNGVDAASVLALMGLGLTGGAELHLRATGPQAAQALEAIVADVEAGFGEE